MVTTMPSVTTSETAPPRRAWATSSRGRGGQADARATRHASVARFYQPIALAARARAFAMPGDALYSEPVPVHIVEHPLVHDALATLRGRLDAAGTVPPHGGAISLLLAAEATRDLPSVAVRSQTPLGPAPEARRVAGGVVVVPVLRAGLGMLDAVLELVPSARVGHIGLQRDEATAIASQSYSRLPGDLTGSFVLMIDPMLATGGSAVAALDLLRDAGARAVRMICIVAAPEGHRAGRAAPSGRRDLHAGDRPRAERAQVHPAGPRRLRRSALRDTRSHDRGVGQSSG